MNSTVGLFSISPYVDINELAAISTIENVFLYLKYCDPVFVVQFQVAQHVAVGPLCLSLLQYFVHPKVN